MSTNLKAQEISYAGSLQYSSGKYYFTESTQSVYLTNGLTVKQGRVNLTLYVPFVIQNTPWISYSQLGHLPTGGPQHDSVGQRGSNGMGLGRHGQRVSLPDTISYQSSSFSDPSFTGSINLLSPRRSTIIQVHGSIKIPLANPDNGFGTGEWDGGMGIAADHRLGRWFIIANILYWWLGDMPDLKLKNTVSYSGGLGRSLGQGKWSVLLSLSGFTEIIEDIDAPMTVASGISYNINRRSSSFANIAFGLTEFSSDISIGVGWTFQL